MKQPKQEKPVLNSFYDVNKIPASLYMAFGCKTEKTTKYTIQARITAALVGRRLV